MFEMSGQIHTVVQNAQHVDTVFFVRPKGNEMPAAAPFSRHMQHMDIRRDIVTGLSINDIRPFEQGFQCQAQSFSVNLSLLPAELLGRPRQNVGDVLLGLGGKPECPVRHQCDGFSRFANEAI